jgi:putative RecB family exonuclease
MTNTQEAACPRDVAEAITGRRHISWSQIQCYQQCPVKYRFRYLDHAEPDFTPSSLAFGGAVHQALEVFCQHVLEGLDTADPKPYASRFCDAWRRASEGEVIRFNKKETHDSVIAMGQRMIEAFVASPASRLQDRIVGIEEELHGPLLDDVPPLLARLDLVEHDPDGRLVITDFKTSAGKWNEDKLIENAAQLQLYADLAKTTGLSPDGIAPRLRFLVITKAAKPAVQAFEVAHDAGRLGRIKAMVRDVWAGIVAGVFPARPGWPCRMCQHGSQCQGA